MAAMLVDGIASMVVEDPDEVFAAVAVWLDELPQAAAANATAAPMLIRRKEGMGMRAPSGEGLRSIELETHEASM